MKKVVFESENIYFIELSYDLIEDYLEMVNNPNINKLISLKNKTYTYEDEMEWVKMKLNSDEVIFSMLDKKTGKFIGNISFMKIENNTAELGISITENFQNQHYGTEALERMIKYGFEVLNLNEIKLGVFSTNLRAIHCYKKLGFTEYDVEENIGNIDGEAVDGLLMKLHK